MSACGAAARTHETGVLDLGERAVEVEEDGLDRPRAGSDAVASDDLDRGMASWLAGTRRFGLVRHASTIRLRSDALTEHRRARARRTAAARAANAVARPGAIH